MSVVDQENLRRCIAWIANKNGKLYDAALQEDR